MMYLPRICEHCINPSCVASCPSGAMYKREEDGIVLVDQEACRSWRFCVSGCPYKKVYFNWRHGQGREVQPLLPADRGRAADRLLGDLRRPPAPPRHRPDRHRPGRGGRLGRRRAGPARGAARPLPRPRGPRGPRAGAAATASPRTGSRRRGARRSTRCASSWRIALPLHPEYRTLPMVWYVPPLSPVESAGRADGGRASTPTRLFARDRRDADPGRVPGEHSWPRAIPSRCGARCERLAAMRSYMRAAERRRTRRRRRSPTTSGWSPPRSRRCSGWSRSPTTTSAT